MNQNISFPGKKELWHGYDSFRFELDGVECVIVKADSPLKGTPWIWRVRFLNADHSLDLAMLRHGVHLAHINISDLAGGPEAMDRMTKFYHYLTETLNFSKAPILESYSRGAFPALNWAIRNPEQTAMLILENPLCNLTTWPKLPSDRELCRKAGVLTDDYRVIPEWNPIENLDSIIKRNCPVTVIYDEKDPAFPIDQNTHLLLQKIRDNGGIAKGLSGRSDFTGDDTEELAQSAIQTWKDYCKI